MLGGNGEETMQLTILGARGSEPVSGPEYDLYGGNTTCYAVRTRNDKLLIFDTGTGLRKLNAIPDQNIYIFWTHGHWDHLLGFHQFKPLFDPRRNIYLHGGINLENGTRSTLEVMYSRNQSPFDIGAHPGIKGIVDFVPGDKVYDDGVTSVDTFLQPRHPQKGSIGYRITEKQGIGLEDKVLVISTDREPDHNGRDQELIERWNSADLVLSDVQYEPSGVESWNKFMPGWGHGDYISTVNMAIRARAKNVKGVHFHPDAEDNYLEGMEGRMSRYALEVAEHYALSTFEAGLARQNWTYQI